MIALLGNAFGLLDEQGREEVFQFIASQQNADGGFQDRGGRPDLYYSLFGGLTLKAMKSEVRSQMLGATQSVTRNPKPATESVLKFKQFIARQSNSEVPGFIEKCCLILLQKEFNIKRFSRTRTLFALAKSFWKERRSINLSYRSFVLFLTLDAVLPSRTILKIGARYMMRKTFVDANSPCSEVAARVFLKKMMNQDGSNDQELLQSFACEPGGFKAFQHSDRADMLSTAVALFALNYAGSDLRFLKPACLDFIQENFAEGAFLSGDGDLTRDLEYTFYGLLTLGVLVS